MAATLVSTSARSADTKGTETLRLGKNVENSGSVDDWSESPQPYDDDLAAAISGAYSGNPEFAARRYDLRATDDALGIALAETRAQIDLKISSGYDFTDPGDATQAGRSLSERLSSNYIRRNDLSGQLSVQQPISTGGRAVADVRAARADISAGQEALRGGEGDLIVQVVKSYSDVRRDQQVLAIRKINCEVLEATLAEVIARREAGELTRTDIAQAETQLQAARAALNLSEAQLEQSRAEFAAIVGREPGNLAPPPNLPFLPGTIDAAFERAEQSNPELKRAIATESASSARIAAARAEKHPQIGLNGSAGATGPVAPFHRYNEDLNLSVRATVTIPISSGGATSARIAQALDRNSADRSRIEVARRQLWQSVLTTWNQVAAAGRNIEIQRSQLSASRTYYEGTLEEYRAGLRSTFDVLYAQNNLRDTQIAFLSSRHDHYVAQSALLRQLGLLEAGRLLVGGPRYDPQDHVKVAERRGALPWDGLVRQLDAFARPTQKPQGPEQPFVSQNRAMIAPSRAGARLPESIERRSVPPPTKAAERAAP